MIDLTAARLARAQLLAEEAPPDVLEAADRAISAAQAGLSVSPDTQAILLKYASQRQQQNRWGK